jgi:hypothetical protein
MWGRAAWTRAKVANISSCHPGYDKANVPNGYIPIPSDTYQGYALLRSVLKSGSDADVANAVTYSKRIKLYPLSQAADQPPTKFVDASGVLFDTTICYDLSFFESLNQIVQADPLSKEQLTNWLPAPKDADFTLYCRAYWPKAPVIDGSWTPPPVERQK